MEIRIKNSKFFLNHRIGFLLFRSINLNEKLAGFDNWMKQFILHIFFRFYFLPLSWIFCSILNRQQPEQEQNCIVSLSSTISIFLWLVSLVFS